MKEKLKAKRILTFIMVMMMLVTSLPVSVLAEGETKLEPIRYLNENVENLPVNVYKPDLSNGKTSGDYIKDPEMAELYTARRDFKVRRGEEFVINYEPYIATVGKDATDEEKAKINKTIPKPEFDGYTSPTPDQRTIEITYNKIKSLAQKGHKDGAEFKGTKDYQYTPKRNKIKVKHVFQSLDDKSIYGRMDGSTKDIETEEWGETGSSITITPLEQMKRPGYVPEENEIITQVPEENVNDIEIEYRYNRARYLVKFDSNGGSDVHSLNIFYGKTIPYNDEEPKKEGCGFVGWITDTDITYGPENDRKPIAAGTLITNKDKVEFTNDAGTKETVNVEETFNGKIFKIDNNIEANGFVNAMPASDIVFKAHWKDKPHVDYTIQYWTEKADYDDKDTNLALRDKYEFIGSYVVKDADTGSQPVLSEIAENNRGADKGNIAFPDLNNGRLEKTQKDKDEFTRYYFLNEKLTEDANKVPDPAKPANKVQKKVLATGETVYNVYYDRRVYTLYFTSINDENDDYAYWPIITKGGQVLGKEGSPYKVDARFNQSLDKIWPKDEEISGLPQNHTSEPVGDDGLIGWMINHNNVDYGVQIFRDTPPYRLSAEDFVDAEDVMSIDNESGGKGHADEIPIADGKTKKRDKYEISLGASYLDTAVIHHVDIIKDDFNGKEQIDYDMTYWKSDTNAVDYDFILPHLQGFTLKEETRKAKWIGIRKNNDDVEKTFDELNVERNAITPFRSDADKIEYISHFPWSNKSFKGTNAYNYASYTRNKYKLKLNNDPKKIKNDKEYKVGEDLFDVYYEYPLKNLDLDTKIKPKKPAWVPKNWEFKGWALDQAGENLVKDGNETKLHYDQFLFAKWGEPNNKYTVKFDLNGGNTNYSIEANDIATHKAGESIETSLGNTKYVLPVKKDDEKNGSIKVFTVENRMNIREPKYNSYSLKPRREGYDFLGWERVRFKNNDPKQGEDDSYKTKYKTEELYAFGNEITSDVYLRAIWVPNHLVNINAYHHFLDLDYKEYEAGNEELIKLGETKSPYVQPLAKKRENKFMAAVASKQGENWYLIPQVEWDSLKNMKPAKDSKDYMTYIEEHKGADGHYTRKNTYNQHGIVEPEFLDDKSKNPKFDSNDFHFYYRRFRQTKYRVNYIDVRGQEEIEKTIKNTALSKDQKETKIDELVKKYGIIASDYIVNGKSDYDARNYRPIKGWKLESKRQQQLFFDLDNQGKLNGINGTGLDEVFFYYTDVRVIDVPKNDPVPDGYVRVTFKADKGGFFGNDKDGNPIKELHYNVIKGLKSDLLPVPELLKDGETADTNKYYITPENGKKFIKWDDKPLLNPNTIIENTKEDYYVFTAKFEWSGLSAKGLVKTEAFIDPNDTWTNDFAPKIEDLKKQLEWKEKDVVKTLPAGTDIKFYDEKGNELKTDEDVFKLVNEKKAADKDELVRTVKIKAKVTFKDGKEPQELTIPITVYKNVYEALNKAGDKPLFLKEAEAKEAKDGGLKDVTGNYVKVTVQPTNKPSNKDAKIYYVNTKAWVEIPEITLTEDEKKELGFTHWSADKDAQNENGVYDFTKRHMFTEDTVISPGFTKDVVEQTDPNTKPPVPDNFVKVIVTTKEDGIEKATEDTKFERTFWVNPTKEVTIPVNEPTGDTVKDDKGNVVTDAAGKEIKWTFKEWSSPLTATFTGKETTITAKYEKTIPEPSVDTSVVETYVGSEPELGDYEKALKMMLDKTGLSFDENVSSFEITKDPDVSKPGMSEAKVKVEFKNGQVKEVTVPVKVYDNIYPGDTNGNKTSETPDNYVKVTVNPKAYDEDDQKIKVYYVNPLAKVSIPEILIKEADKEEYGFKKWTTNNKEINSSNNDEIYDFAKDYKFTTDTEIYAFYEKNGEPEIKIDFETKEIVKNIGDKVSVKEYEDALIVPKDPEGKGIAEIKGINILEEPDTSKEGYTTAKIQVVYDDGKSQELIVLVKVLPDVVEQTDPDKKPDVPNDFVKVIIKTTEKVVDNGVEIEEERATEDTKFERTFWANPDKVVTIDVKEPTGIKDITDNRTWNFDYWKVDEPDGKEYKTTITDQFTKETTILAKYTKDEVEKPSAGDVITEEGVQPSKKDYLDKIYAPNGKTINDIKIIKEPDVSRPGVSTATIEVEYNDGTKNLVDVKVFVQRKNEPRPSEPQIIYRDRIVEKEKIVEKIVKIKDNERLKELRYMQGFNGKFRPYDGLRRSEAAQILANALKADGYAYDPYYPISYTDIGDTWYTEAVRIVSQAGVFQGYSDGTFKPEGKITRAEWVATLRRFQHLKAISGNTMGLRLGHWATEEIEAAYREGWLNIYTNGIAKFDADMPITRQEVAAVSNKAFERLVDKEYIDKNDDALINYVDINPMMPLYEDILCASNSFLHDNDYYLAHNIRKNINEFNINISKYKIYQDKFQRVFEK